GVLAFFSVRVHRHAEANLGDDPLARRRLAGDPAARACRARNPAATGRLAVRRPPPPVLPARLASVAATIAVGPARDRARRGDADQDLEQRAHRAPAAGAGEAAARGEDRGAREPDQSALPLQHADVDLVADPHAAGDGAHADYEALRPAAPAD